MALIHTYHRQSLCCPTPQSKNFWFKKNYLKPALNVCSNKNWIGGSGVCDIWENSMIILLILIQKSYFFDNDAFFDVMIQEPDRKWRQNTTDLKSAGIYLLNYYSLRPSQPFSFVDKSTGPHLPFLALALYFDLKQVLKMYVVFRILSFNSNLIFVIKN